MTRNGRGRGHANHFKKFEIPVTSFGMSEAGHFKFGTRTLILTSTIA